MKFPSLSCFKALFKARVPLKTLAMATALASLITEASLDITHSSDDIMINLDVIDLLRYSIIQIRYGFSEYR